MALNQFIEFMENDLDGQSSSMCSFLSKRARLMISFSIDLLGQYLKILRRPGVEENVDVNAFLDDISNNLEEFKQTERRIRDIHFNYQAETELIDTQMAQSDIFNPRELSQIHSVSLSYSDPKSLFG